MRAGANMGLEENEEVLGINWVWVNEYKSHLIFFMLTKKENHLNFFCILY